MTFLLQFNSLRKRLNLQRKRRLHASPNTLSYEATAFNQRDKSVSSRTGAQIDFFVVSVSFQGLNQRLNLVEFDKTNIVTHVQPPSIKNSISLVGSKTKQVRIMIIGASASAVRVWSFMASAPPVAI